MPLELLKQDAQAYADQLLGFLGEPPVVLTAEDKRPVLKAAKARSKVLARLAKTAANGLRSIGLLRMLGHLKRMKLVRAVLYQTVEVEQVTDFGSAAAKITQLDASYPNIARLL